MEKIDTIKQLWFAEAIQNYIDSTSEILLPEEIADFKLRFEKIKDCKHLLTIQSPVSGDDPYIITLMDIDGMTYSEDVGKVLVHAVRITTLKRNGCDFAVTTESNANTVLDIDVVDLRACSKQDATLLYKMFHTIWNAVETGISWLL